MLEDSACAITDWGFDVKYILANGTILNIVQSFEGAGQLNFEKNDTNWAHCICSGWYWAFHWKN